MELNLTDGQRKLLIMLKDDSEGKLPEMYPNSVDLKPNIPCTYNELVELRSSGLILFTDYIKEIGNLAVNAYHIASGAKLNTFKLE